ncbi:MAG TPA: FAD-binding oxidoreductase [Nocardioidaceae bacterium]|nr:FAD-binding oxidoreductase [Nocardioidaceae bacterium]
MAIESAAEPVAAALRGLAGGRVYLPGDPAYDEARMPWNVAVDQRPAAVALPQTAAEVSALVRIAAENGLVVAPQSTGHNPGPLAARGLDNAVIVRMSEMNKVTVDPARRRARVEGGAMWLPAVEAAAEHGLATLHGSSPDVGIAGYSLGGGTGWYARQLGLACNSLTAVEVVIGDGTVVRADANHEAPLFWALRGGGGNFGVATALEFQLYPVETTYAGMLVWDIADAEKVLRAWAAWAPAAPDEVTTSFRILRLPPLPDIPEIVRGRNLVMIDGAVLGSDDRGRELLAGLRAVQPEIDTFDRVPARSLSRLHMDPEGPTPAVSSASMLDALPDAGVDALLSAVGPEAESSLLISELRQLGGALGRPHEGGGALSKLDAQFACFGAAIAATPEMASQGHVDAARFTSALAPWTNDCSYLNFSENAIDPRSAYSDEVWLQLAGIRCAVDPDDVFLANHKVPRLFDDGRPVA